jgi:hypothetical protein
MRRFLPLLLVGAASVAAAATFTVSWNNATQNTDGTAIPASGPGSIVSTRIEYGTCNGTAFGTKQGEWVVTGSVESAPTPDFAPGTYCLRNFQRNTYGNESGASNVFQKVVPAPTPKPATNFGSS